MFFTAFVLCILKLFKLKTEGQTLYRNPHMLLKYKFSLPGLANCLCASLQHTKFTRQFLFHF